MARLMKTDRRIQLARGKPQVERIATRMKLAAVRIIEVARRFGLHLLPLTTKRYARLKAKG